MSAAYGITLLHLVIGEHRAECRTPVHRSFSLICNTILHKHSCLLGIAESIPLLSRERSHICAGRIDGSISFLSEKLLKLRNRTSLLLNVIVPAVEHLKECPLSPLVISRITGTDLARPVVRETDPVHLLTVTCNIVFRRDSRMLSGLDGILLCRKSECIISHRMKHIESAKPLVAAVYVTCNISERMSYMQTCSRRIWEHVKHIILRL